MKTIRFFIIFSNFLLLGSAHADSVVFSPQMKNLKQIYESSNSPSGQPASFSIEADQSGDPHAIVLNDGKKQIVITKDFLNNPSLSEDGRVMTLCHELGHHFGGAPRRYKTQMESFFDKDGSAFSWSSVEGQADYYAAAKCAKIVFAMDGASGQPKPDTVPARVRGLCDEVYQSDLARGVCYRINLAGLNMLEAYNTKNEVFGFDFKEANVSGVTLETHPKKQCRLDTILAGSLCSQDPKMKADPKDPTIGFCESGAFHALTKRPACWYSSDH